MAFRVLVVLSLFAGAVWAQDLEEEVEAYLLDAPAEPPPEKTLRWVITGAVGGSITDGNSDTTTVTGELKFERQWTKWSMEMNYLGLFEEAGGVEQNNKHIFTAKAERSLGKHDAVFVLLLAEHDAAADLKLRLQPTAGYKWRQINKKNFWLDFDVGGGFVYEDYSTTGDDTNTVGQAGFKFEWKITKHLTYTQRLVYFPTLSDWPEYRLASVSEFVTPIGKDVNFKLTILDQYNSNPAPGTENNDLTVTFALQFKL
jgi:putative salt-induced outer membrane protein